MDERWFITCSCENVLAFTPFSLQVYCTLCHGRHTIARYSPEMIRKVRVVAGGDAFCDSRCINATGPDCDCSCGGANHGRGRMGEGWRP